MTAENALELVKDELNLVEKALSESIGTGVPLINEVVTYILSSGGKRLRPAFMILASKMCGYTGSNHIMLSAVIEYIHTATLLHDDIIDGATYRRSRPSANGIYGNDIAVLCGDFLYSRGYILLTDYGDKTIQKILSATAMIMSEGEVIQLIKTGDTKICFDDYLKIIECKTAVLFASSCEIGARLANLSEEKAVALRNFGRYLGLAFQMSDDILDYLGDPEKTGKKPGTDLQEGKLTLPVITLLKYADNSEKSKITDIFTNDTRTDEDLEYIINLMGKYCIKDKSEKIMLEYISTALKNLEVFPSSQYREGMEALAKAMIHRQK